MRPFDPPWVTVLRGPDELERFLGDPGEQRAAGAVELRYDLWEPADLRRTVASSPTPVIHTYRAHDPTVTPAARRAVLVDRAREGDWVDLDHDDPLVGEWVGEGLPHRLILSDHLDHVATDAEVRRRIADLARRGAQAVKIVLSGGGLARVRQALRVAAEPWERPVAIFAGGLEGVPSRILGPGRGCAWTYGRLRGSPGTDVGQPVTTSVPGRYGSHLMAAPVFGVLGADVRRSLSPGFHNRLPGSHLLLDVSLASPEGVLDSDPDLAFAGFAVTAPHKGWARRVAGPGVPEDAEVPAWNTLRRTSGGQWCGFNTDGPAVVGLLQSAAFPRGPLTILGAGGAALGVGVFLRRAGWKPHLVARRPEAATEARGLGFPVFGEIPDGSTGIINATGAGRREGDPWPWDLSPLPANGWALDMTYDPDDTDFLRRVCARGAQKIPGSSMFAAQAALQAALLFGVEVEPEAAEELVRAARLELLEG